MEQLHGIIDTHAHYDDHAFDEDREELIASLFDSGVEYVVNAGCSIASSKRAIEFTKKYDQFYAWCGIHPSDCGDIRNRERTLFELETLIRQPKVVGIGEIGLDYHYPTPEKEVQQRWFEWQMQIAARTGRPVAIHDRDAHGDTVTMIKKYPDVKGVLHSFSGSAETAMELVRLGWYISFSGVVTFKNAQKTRLVAEAVPLDRMLIETDCPYLTPEPNRGKRNDSRNLVYTATCLAEIKGISPQEMCDVTAENAKRFLGIK